MALPKISREFVHGVTEELGNPKNFSEMTKRCAEMMKRIHRYDPVMSKMIQTHYSLLAKHDLPAAYFLVFSNVKLYEGLAAADEVEQLKKLHAEGKAEEPPLPPPLEPKPLARIPTLEMEDFSIPEKDAMVELVNEILEEQPEFMAYLNSWVEHSTETGDNCPTDILMAGIATYHYIRNAIKREAESGRD